LASTGRPRRSNDRRGHRVDVGCEPDVSIAATIPYSPRLRDSRPGMDSVDEPPRLHPVGCENLVTRPRRTRERHRRDGHGAEYERHRMPTPLQLAALAQATQATALDGAGARCSDRRTPQGSAQGAAGSESGACRNILSGRCARTARQSRMRFVLAAPASQAVAVPVLVSVLPDTEAPTMFVQMTGAGTAPDSDIRSAGVLAARATVPGARTGATPVIGWRIVGAAAGSCARATGTGPGSVVLGL